MAQLTPLSQVSANRGYDLKANDLYDPTGETAYGANGEKIGRIQGALVDDTTAKLRYLIVNVGNWFFNKDVLVPVGMARFEDDAVYFDSLTRDQVNGMREYTPGMMITDEYEYHNESALTGRRADIAPGTSYDYRDTDTDNPMFRTPQRLQLLEERLVVDKQREKVGEVEIGKRVETRQENVDVNLSRDEVVIERRPVTDTRPVEGGVALGASSETIRVDLEADRANVHKQAYVTEEVEVSKRQDTETKTFTEEVGREVLEVERTGDVRVTGDTNTSQKR
jgi:uncharacterized protein (TIGR02271 family)